MRLLIPLLFFPLFCVAQKPLPSTTAAQLMSRASASDTVYVINFWATWCPPCVAELPEFDALQQRYANRPVKVLLVSLDFKEDVAFKVPTFIQRKRLLPEVLWLSETDANAFIPKIENRWTGSIPATLVLDNRHKTRTFLEQSIRESDLTKIIDKALQP